MITRVLSVSFLVLAVALVAYSLFGLSHFAGYAGEYIDDRLFLFDNGVYPFMWGIVLTVIGQLARLRHRRRAIVIAAGTALPLLVWKRATVPSLAAGQELFPDAALLSELMAVCAVLLCLVLANRHIQRLLHAFFLSLCPAIATITGHCLIPP